MRLTYVCEKIVYICNKNGHFKGMTDIHEYIQNAMATYCIIQFFMAYIS